MVSLSLTWSELNFYLLEELPDAPCELPAELDPLLKLPLELEPLLKLLPELELPL